MRITDLVNFVFGGLKYLNDTLLDIVSLGFAKAITYGDGESFYYFPAWRYDAPHPKTSMVYKPYE